MHHAAPLAWQRAYDYHPGTNRLRATSLPGNDPNNPATFTALYTHDAHGNMTALAQIPGGLTWDHADRLQRTDPLARFFPCWSRWTLRTLGSNGEKRSVHFFQSKSRKVFDVDNKKGWSNRE